EEINVTRATIILDWQITCCHHLEVELPNWVKILEMKPKPIDSQSLITNNLSNLEAKEEEDIIGSLSDVDDHALLGETSKPKSPNLPTFCECHVNKTINQMLECDAQIKEICRIWYHPECENICEVYFLGKNNRKKAQNTLYWECSNCFIRAYFQNLPHIDKGLVKYQTQNTCTINPCLTSFYIKAKFCQNFLTQLPIELTMFKNSLNLGLQHKFAEASSEWVNYLCFHKNVVPTKTTKEEQWKYCNYQ
uniref:Uncharacterized protein n=1 Tax=Romanomermis culicivorax TaxID=13658 RepID=A0A915JUR7_ROMCU